MILGYIWLLNYSCCFNLVSFSLLIVFALWRTRSFWLTVLGPINTMSLHLNRETTLGKHIWLVFVTLVTMVGVLDLSPLSRVYHMLVCYYVVIDGVIFVSRIFLILCFFGVVLVSEYLFCCCLLSSVKKWIPLII